MLFVKTRKPHPCYYKETFQSKTFTIFFYLDALKVKSFEYFTNYERREILSGVLVCIFFIFLCLVKLFWLYIYGVGYFELCSLENMALLPRKMCLFETKTVHSFKMANYFSKNVFWKSNIVYLLMFKLALFKYYFFFILSWYCLWCSRCLLDTFK